MEARAGLRRLLVTLAPFPVAAGAVGAAYALLRDRLPATVASHFGFDGRADGFTSPGAFLGVAVGLLLVLGVLFALFVLARLVSARGSLALGYGVAALLGYVFTAVLLVNAGTGAGADPGASVDPAAVTLPVWQLGVALGLGVLAAGAGWLLAGADAPVPPEGDAAGGEPRDVPRLDLADAESAVWSRTVTSPGLYALGCALLLGGLVAAPFTGWGAASGPLAGGAVVLVLGGLRVTADRRGLTVAPPFLPYPRMRIPLDRIRTAGSREVSAVREFGGWGYRMRPGRSGFVLRSGEALALRLTNGREWVVTVDDAATAAALLNTLLDRLPERPDGPDGEV